MAVDGMLTTVSDFVAFNGGSGIYRPSAVSDALVLAEGEVEKWLSTPTTPQTFVDEFDWPVDQNRMYLRKVRVLSITGVTGLRSDGQGNWQTSSELYTILDYKQSIIRFMDPMRYWCASGGCPERLRVTYVAGFSAAESATTTKDGVRLRAVIFNAALAFLQTGIGLNTQGNNFISSYTAAGYSESRQLPEMSGASNYMNQFMQEAKEMARALVVKRPINFRSSGIGRAC